MTKMMSLKCKFYCNQLRAITYFGSSDHAVYSWLATIVEKCPEFIPALQHLVKTDFPQYELKFQKILLLQ